MQFKPEITFSENPMHPILSRSISWSTVSKKICKSIKIKPMSFPDLQNLCQLNLGLN